MTIAMMKICRGHDADTIHRCKQSRCPALHAMIVTFITTKQPSEQSTCSVFRAHQAGQQTSTAEMLRVLGLIEFGSLGLHTRCGVGTFSVLGY